MSPSTIKIGYISSLTGNASSSFADGPGAAQARIDAQNAAGGVDGRQLQLVVTDDQSSPQTDATASQDLVSNKGVFAVVDVSPYTVGGARVLQSAGVPVTGSEFDGPEWGQQPYSNMFSYGAPLYTPYNGTYYNFDYFGKFFQQVGVTKLAGLAYGVSTSSQESIKAAFAGAAGEGISNCYANYSVPFGGVDFTADALAIKSAGCNGVVGSFVDSSDVGLTTTLKQADVKSTNLWYTGYDQQTLSSSSAKAAFEGDYFTSPILFDPPNPAVATMLNTLKTYDKGYTAGTIPDVGVIYSYIATDLMIKGLEEAGANPTRKSFISNLRTVTDYTAGGLLPSPTSFANFGTPQMIPQTACFYFLQLKNGAFVSASPDGKAICGNRISYKL